MNSEVSTDIIKIVIIDENKYNSGYQPRDDYIKELLSGYYDSYGNPLMIKTVPYTFKDKDFKIPIYFFSNSDYLGPFSSSSIMTTKIKEMLYQNVSGILFTFDQTRIKPFSYIWAWVKDAITYNSFKLVPIFLVGYSNNQKESSKILVTNEMIQDYAKRLSNWSSSIVNYSYYSDSETNHVEELAKTVLEINFKSIKISESKLSNIPKSN